MIRGWGRSSPVESVSIERLVVVAPVASLMGHTYSYEQVTYWLFPILSVSACCLRMEILFSIVLERKTLMRNEVNEDGSVAVSAPV